MIFLLHTGLRLNEALSLDMGDLQMTGRKGSVMVRLGKGRKSRSVSLNLDARKAQQASLFHPAG